MGMPIGLVFHVVFYPIVQVEDPSCGNNVTVAFKGLLNRCNYELVQQLSRLMYMHHGKSQINLYIREEITNIYISSLCKLH